METAKNIGRRDFLRRAALAAGALAFGGCSGRNNRQKKTNIVFIMADDLGWRDVGFMGSRFYDTPNLDRLAGEGMVFTDAYANAPNCAPTRASLLTGQYSPRHGVITVNSSERGESFRRKLIPVENKLELGPDAVTIAEILDDAGYATASVGKWHLGDDPETGPVSQGFGLNVGGYHLGHPRSHFSPYSNPALPDGPPGEYLGERLTNEAVEFLRANRDQPFFLYLPFYNVHTPIQPRPELVERYRTRAPDGDQRNPEYAAMVEAMDSCVGRVLAALDELKLADDTVVFFFSDNGGHLKYTDNSPLRGGKGMLQEGGIRVPLIVRAPGRTVAGSRCGVPVIGVDFLPTMLELAGVSPQRGLALDGTSIVPLLDGAAELPREAIFWHLPVYLENWSYSDIRDPHWRLTPSGAVRAGRWKLIEHFEDWSVELYDLEHDVGETHNLADSHPAERDRLRSLLRQWRKDVGARVPVERNPDYDPSRAEN